MEKKQGRSWVLTLPREEYDQETVEKELGKYTYAGQLECGKTTGYFHWQILIENASPIAFTTLQKKFPKGHFEPRKGTKEQALAYVQKDDSFAGVRIGCPEKIAVMAESKASGALAALHERVMNGASVSALMMESPLAMRYQQQLRGLQTVRDAVKAQEWRDVKVSYLYGPTRCGKTTLLSRRYGNTMYRVSDYAHPFDAYNGEDVLVLDEFYSENIRLGRMLNLLDGHRFSLPARYANPWAFYTKVFLVSNKPLQKQYWDEQTEEPEGYAAFLARFSSYQRMDADGSITELELLK